jgi:hypothetical protein
MESVQITIRRQGATRTGARRVTRAKSASTAARSSIWLLVAPA